MSQYQEGSLQRVLKNANQYPVGSMAEEDPPTEVPSGPESPEKSDEKENENEDSRPQTSKSTKDEVKEFFS